MGFQGVDIASPFQHLFDEGSVDADASKDFVNSQNVFSTRSWYPGFHVEEGNFTGELTKQYQLCYGDEFGIQDEEHNWLFAAECR
jgi:hypothetical protein